MTPALLNTAPPFVMVKLLQEPELPTVRPPLLLQTEPGPVTTTALSTPLRLRPMMPLVSDTVAAFDRVSVLPEPAQPT